MNDLLRWFSLEGILLGQPYEAAPRHTAGDFVLTLTGLQVRPMGEERCNDATQSLFSGERWFGRSPRERHGQARYVGSVF
jgi:hypothetical protein